MTVPAAADPPRPGYERAAHEREVPGLLDALHADPTTRVLALSQGRAAFAGAGLHLIAASEFEASDLLGFLGRVGGDPVVLALVDQERAERLAPPEGWAELRVVGGDLSETDAALFITALALSRFIRDAAYCPKCGGPAGLRQAGWSRRCEQCGREHFPRTDPAVIVAVTDAGGARLLLGSNAAWPAGRFSCFAGFIEAGESAESALVREVHEEAGVRVADLEYLGSQSWPYPRSLMLGYLATALDAEEARADGEEINEVRWFDPAEIGAALAADGMEEGELTLPGRASIARGLIQTWHDRATASAAVHAETA